MATVTIKDVQTILTQPEASRLIIVKIITSQPGLYGLGCATFTQRFHAVHAAIEKHLKPFLLDAMFPASRKFGRWRWSTATGATAPS